MAIVISRSTRNPVKRKEALYAHYDPSDYKPEKVLNLKEDGTLSLDSFRVILYIAIGLATLRSHKEIIRMCGEDMKVTPTSAVIRKVEEWMIKLELNPDKKLYGKATRWREIFAQFQLTRANYMNNLRDEPLAHPRGRFTKLKQLLDKAEEGSVRRVHIIKRSVVDNLGVPLTDENGKHLVVMETIAEKEPDLATAVQIVKLMGQESGTLVEKHEHKHSFPELVREYRKKQNIVEAEYTVQLTGSLSEGETE